MLINGQEGSAANYSEMSPIEIFEKINNHRHAPRERVS